MASQFEPVHVAPRFNEHDSLPKSVPPDLHGDGATTSCSSANHGKSRAPMIAAGAGAAAGVVAGAAATSIATGVAEAMRAKGTSPATSFTSAFCTRDYVMGGMIIVLVVAIVALIIYIVGLRKKVPAICAAPTGATQQMQIAASAVAGAAVQPAIASDIKSMASKPFVPRGAPPTDDASVSSIPSEQGQHMQIVSLDTSPSEDTNADDDDQSDHAQIPTEQAEATVAPIEAEPVADVAVVAPQPTPNVAATPKRRRKTATN